MQGLVDIEGDTYAGNEAVTLVLLLVVAFSCCIIGTAIGATL